MTLRILLPIGAALALAACAGSPTEPPRAGTPTVPIPDQVSGRPTVRIAVGDPRREEWPVPPKP